MSEAVAAGRQYLRHAGRSFLPVGAHVVPPEGPDWPWRVGPEAFGRAFGRMAALGLDTARIDLLWAAIEPRPGTYDEAHLRQLDAILEAARANGLRLHPALFVGGEVGDAYWDVPWRDGRHPHRDPEMLRFQAEHAAMLGRRWHGDPALLAWDLTDEPPLWLFGDTTDDDARAWTGALAAALRSADPAHLVTIGTAEQEVGWGPFRPDVVGDQLDFTCVHPYPIYRPELYPDGLLGPRMTRAAAFETALAAGVGRPVMVHEYGASSAQFDPERIAAYDRLLCWSALGAGAAGFLAWCWTDAEPAAYGRAPYVRQPHETQFGVTDWRGELRPRGRVLGELAATVRALDIDRLAADGAQAGAAIMVPHEYAHPYDTAAFGLEPPAGPYHPAEQAWSPVRDPLPLVRAWLNSFVLASRAGMQAAFPRESLAGSWPNVPLLILPAPLATSANSLLHVRTSWWRGATDFFARGGTLYLSLSADAAVPEMAEIAGCRIADRAPADRAATLRFVAPWGPFRVGDELSLPAGDGTLATRGVRVTLAGGVTVAVDAAGEPVLVAAERGAGHAVTCAYPVELLLAAVADAHGPGDRTWGLYAGLADLAGARSAARAEHPEAMSGELRGPRGGLLALTNHGAEAIEATLTLPAGTGTPRLVAPAGAAGGFGSRSLGRGAPVQAGPKDRATGDVAGRGVERPTLLAGGAAIRLPPYGAVVVSWRTGADGRRRSERA